MTLASQSKILLTFTSPSFPPSFLFSIPPSLPLPLPSLPPLPHVQLCVLHLAVGVREVFAVGLLSEEAAMTVVTLLAACATRAPQVCVYVSTY